MLITYRWACAEDAEALAPLIDSAYRGDAPTSEAHLLKGPRTDAAELHDLISDSDSRLLLAEAEGRVVGTCLLQKRGDGGAYFGMFAVSPAFQGAGMGAAIIKEAEARVRVLWGARSLQLTVINLRTELIAWYERRGFARTGETEPFPFSATTGEVRRDFHLCVLRKSLA